MPDEWVPVAYASVIVKGLDLQKAPVAATPVFFDNKAAFNRFAAPFEAPEGLNEVALDGMIESGPWQKQRDCARAGPAEIDDRVTFASVFDARLAALKIEGLEGMAIGPQSCFADLNILFAPGVNAIGFDLFQIDAALEGLTVNLFDLADRLIGTKGITCRGKCGFFGVVDDKHQIGRISLHANYSGQTDTTALHAAKADAEASVANDNSEPGAIILFALGLASLGVARRSGSAIAHLKGR